MRTSKIKEFKNKRFQEQIEWVKQCGETLSGYLVHYPSLDLEQVEAIYNADIAALERYEYEVKAFNV